MPRTKSCEHIQFRVTAEEKAHIRQRATQAGKQMSAWIRGTLLNTEDLVVPAPGRTWITCGTFSVLLNHTEEGLIIDVYHLDEEDSDSIGTLGFLTEE